ncbi:HDOD domain-containing protein [Calditrichota bacterium LG25]
MIKIKNRRVQNFLKNSEQLPSLPVISLKIIQLTEDPDFEIKDMANIIKADAVFTGKLLRIVNSSYFGLRREVKSIEQAISLLGVDSIRNLAITFSLFDVFPADHSDIYPELFKKSLCAGIVSNFVSEIVPQEEKEELFLASTLQYLGAFFLTFMIPKTYRAILEEGRRRGLPYLFIEKAELGITHLEIGLFMAKKWRLPKIIEQALQYRIKRDIYFFKDSSQEIISKLEIVRVGSLAAEIFFGYHRALSMALFRQNLRHISGQITSEVAQDLLSSVPNLMKNMYDQYGLDFTGDMSYDDIVREAEQELIQLSYRNVRTYFEMQRLKNQLNELEEKSPTN